MSKQVKLPEIIARLKVIMWDNYRVSWGLDEVGRIPPDKDWKVSHSPGQFFEYALKHGEITQAQFDQYKAEAGTFWSIDLVR